MITRLCVLLDDGSAGVAYGVQIFHDNRTPKSISPHLATKRLKRMTGSVQIGRMADSAADFIQRACLKHAGIPRRNRTR